MLDYIAVLAPPMAMQSLDGSPSPPSAAAAFGIAATILVMLLLPILLLRSRK